MRQSQQTQQITAQQQQQQQHQQQQLQQQAAAQQQQASHDASQLFAPISASIPRYWFSEDKYWFVIEASLEDGRHWELQRYYEDFYDFQIALLTEFPAEAGNTGQKRSLPYMPGPVNYVTDQITDGRRHNLDAYVKNLLTQPPYISRCSLVKQFFAPREGDFEIDPDALADEDGAYRDSGGSAGSSTGNLAEERAGSRGDLDANGGGYGGGGLSAAPMKLQQHGAGYAQQAQEAGSPPPQGEPLAVQQSAPAPQQQQQQLSQQPAGQAMKVKIYFGDDLFAIRVPAEIGYEQLHEKIRERLKIPAGEEIGMAWRDEAGGGAGGQQAGRVEMRGDEDLDEALRVGGGKLVIFVEYL